MAWTLLSHRTFTKYGPGNVIFHSVPPQKNHKEPWIHMHMSRYEDKYAYGSFSEMTGGFRNIFNLIKCWRKCCNVPGAHKIKHLTSETLKKLFFPTFSGVISFIFSPHKRSQNYLSLRGPVRVGLHSLQCSKWTEIKSCCKPTLLCIFKGKKE